MTENRMKELSYYLFFALMIFAKGIGLDSGNRLYYVLSGVACVCVGIKVLLTKYRMREVVAMALLCAIAFVAYKNSGRLGIVLSVLTVIGLKDMDVKKLFRMGAVIYGCSFAFTVAAAKFGLIGNPLVVHEKGGMELIRWGMGYSTGNVFHVSYFMLTVLFCYTWGKRCNRRRLLGLMAGDLLVFLYTLSYTGVMVTAIYLLLDYYAVRREEFCAAKGAGISAAERLLCQLPLPLCLLFSFGAPFLLEYPVMQKLNNMLQARLSYSAYYLQNQPITLLGTRMKDVPNFWVIMDNGYVYFFMTFGAAAFVLFCAGYAVVIGRYSGLGKYFAGKKGQSRGWSEEEGKELYRAVDGRGMPEMGRAGAEPEKQEGFGERLPELAMIFSFLLYGIMEQFLSNAFMNFSLLFLGEVLFGPDGVRYEDGADSAWRRKAGLVWRGEEAASGDKDFDRRGQYAMGLACGVFGLVIFSVYYFAVPVKEYIRVPVETLNYVDAQSIHISVEGNGERQVKEEGQAGGIAADKGMGEANEETENVGADEETREADGGIKGVEADEGMRGNETDRETEEAGEDMEKDVLKERMKAYGEALEEPAILSAVLRETGLGDRLSEEELAAALEYSIPVKIYEDGELGTFRVRLLKLYCDITEEEYRGLLEHMIALVQEKESGKYSVKGGVYGERIGKSSGDDRIEHMSKDKAYEVEKAGNIVKMEHFRDSVFWGVLGMAASAAAWVLVCRKRF